MITFFIKRYDIPTRKDLQLLLNRMDQLEKLVRAVTAEPQKRKNHSPEEREVPRITVVSASRIVFDIISESGRPVSVKEIMEKTGYDEKKTRNIIYRLAKTGKISRAERGRYAVG